MGTSILGTYDADSIKRGAFRRGARTLNLRGDTRGLYRSARTAEIADTSAVWDDWRMVGEDLAEVTRATKGKVLHRR